MSFELFANNFQTTLTANVAAGDATLTVNSAVGAPATAQFRILIDNELLLVTAGGSGTTTWSVTRGIEGTTAASHTAGATVSIILSNGSLLQFAADSVQQGTYAALPAASRAGRLYYTTDSPFIARDNGASWDWYYGGSRVTPLSDASFSWVNQHSANKSVGQGIVNINNVNGGVTGANVNGRVMTAPATPWRRNALVQVLGGSQDQASFGLFWRDSGSGKLELQRFVYDATNKIWHLQYANYSSPTASVGIADDWNTAKSDMFGQLIWLAVEDDGTNHNGYVSTDGINWTLNVQVARASYLPSGGDGLGFYIEPQSGNRLSLSVLSWAVG